MRYSLILLALSILIISCNNEIEKKSTKINYNNIESGLQPAVVIQDSSANTYSVEEAMRKYNIPGVSMAVFKDGNIVWTKHYGNKSAMSNEAINKNTKFQAASISKAVTAFGVLKLVEKYNLNLDTDINEYLKSWKIKSDLTTLQKVTIRQLLNHTSGATVEGFHGYSKTKTVPSLVNIIEGKGNSPVVKIKTVPGSTFSYSGGGFAILQILVEDISGKTFETFFEEEVFKVLKMNHSTFNQLPEGNVALGHNKEGKVHPEGWLLYPEMAAAGLWTTPTDLAKFCIALEDSYYGKNESFITKELAVEMLTVTKVWGLGIGIRGEGDNTYFFHGGANPGAFKSLMVNMYKKHTGIVVMTNAGQGGKLHDDVLRSFSSFLNDGLFKPKYVAPIDLTSEKENLLTGTYHFKEMGDYFLELYTDVNNRFVLYDPNDESKVTLVPVSETEFVDIETGNRSSFVIDSISGKVKEMNYSNAYNFQKVE